MAFLFHQNRLARLLLYAVLCFALIGCNAGMQESQIVQLTSPDGKIELSVVKIRQDAFRIDHSKGPDFTRSGMGISGVTEYRFGSFSPDSRYSLLVFVDASGAEKYHLIDYELTLSGGLNLESSCKAEKTFVQSVQPQVEDWKKIQFQFLKWHDSENWMLFRYTITTWDAEEYVGQIWFDREAEMDMDRNTIAVWAASDQ